MFNFGFETRKGVINVSFTQKFIDARKGRQIIKFNKSKITIKTTIVKCL